jgi:hypothetical protein
MTLYVVGYGVHPSKVETFDDVTHSTKEIIGSWRSLDPTWLVVSNVPAIQVGDYLWSRGQADDPLLVVAYGPENSG